MERIDMKQPFAVLTLPGVDTDLVRALSRYYLVMIEQFEDSVMIELYIK